MKYIDADLLRKKIEKQLKNVRDYMNGAGMKYKGPKYFKAQGKESAYDALLNTIDSLQQERQEEPDTRLEEAAEKSSVQYYKDAGYSPFPNVETAAHKSGFIAGANWQKEQDQPITGNSLEREWLRYVDKEKKGHGGELPNLGEYGWLLIARHFYELGKNSK